MSKTAFGAAFAFVLAACVAAAHAQEAAPVPEASDDQGPDRAQPPRRIQVLQSPYDISSFYRSSQGGPGMLDYAPGPDSTDGSGPYAIAGFYRSQRGARGGYSAFWTSGYGTSRVRGRGILGATRGRALGLNGDLFLFAPTFLAPVGPLMGVFWNK